MRGQRVQAAGAVTAAGDGVVMTARAAAPGQKAAAAGYGWATWPLTPLTVDAGGGTTLPAIPWFAEAPPA